MTASRTEAVDQIWGLFKTAWDTTGHGDRVQYENVGKAANPPSGQEPWARCTLRHNTSRNTSIGGTVGQRRFTRTGTLTVQIFEVLGQGLTSASDLAKIVQEAFEGKTTSGGVIFREVSINEVGQNGDFFQTNVTAFFEYDEIR